MNAVSCMDPRCDPSKFLNTALPFATLRNAGGRVTPDVLRSILTLRSLNLGAEQGTVLVVQHTGKIPHPALPRPSR